MDPNHVWNLFAVLRDQNLIRRVSLEQGVQSQVVTLFLRQYAALGIEDREHVPFDPSLKPDRSEIFILPAFELPQNVASAVQEPLSLETLSDDESELEKVKALFLASRESDAVLFQVFDRRQILSRKRLTLILGSGTFGRLDLSGFSVDTKLVAAFTEGDLYFESFHMARRVLDLASHFREATDGEIQAFAESAVLDIETDELLELADSWVRKKVALIQRSSVLTTVSIERIRHAGMRYGLDVATDQDGRIQVPREKKDFKNLLRVLDEDFYTSDLTSTKFLSNSKRRLPEQ